MGADSGPLPFARTAQDMIRIITDMPATLTDHYLEERGQIPC
jgi:hypothetical protein